MQLHTLDAERTPACPAPATRRNCWPTTSARQQQAAAHASTPTCANKTHERMEERHLQRGQKQAQHQTDATLSAQKFFMLGHEGNAFNCRSLAFPSSPPDLQTLSRAFNAFPPTTHQHCHKGDEQHIHGAQQDACKHWRDGPPHELGQAHLHQLEHRLRVHLHTHTQAERQWDNIESLFCVVMLSTGCRVG